MEGAEPQASGGKTWAPELVTCDVGKEAETGSGDFSVQGLAKTELRNLIRDCRVPDSSHISQRAFLPELGVLLRILLRIRSVSTSLMVGVGSGRKHLHA